MPSHRPPIVALAALLFASASWGLAPVITRYLVIVVDPLPVLVLPEFQSIDNSGSCSRQPFSVARPTFSRTGS